MVFTRARENICLFFVCLLNRTKHIFEDGQRTLPAYCQPMVHLWPFEFKFALIFNKQPLQTFMITVL